MTAAENLLEDAFQEWMDAVESDAPTRRPAALGDSGIRQRATAGHSPSARALVNAGDAVVAFAAAAAAADPPPTLRSRVLAMAAARASHAAPRVSIELSKVVPASERLGRLHMQSADEAVRRARIEALGAMGGPGHEETDRALAILLEQIAPFFDFEIVLVSAVVGDKTIHRVHRGFPASLGNMDVVPRELSFCTHTVSAREPFVVENAAAEAFFRASVLVRTMGARAYVGVPLFGGDVALGALCAISQRPHKITVDDVSALAQFARVVEAVVLRDAASLAAVVPGAGPGLPSPVVYASSFFGELARVQAARAHADPAVHAAVLAELPRGAWSALELPSTLVTGESESGVSLLIPTRHPDSSSVVSTLDKHGAARRPVG